MPSFLSVTTGAVLIVAATAVAAAIIIKAARSIESFRHEDHEAFTSQGKGGTPGGDR